MVAKETANQLLRRHFIKRFMYYILKQLTDNVERFRKQGQTDLMYQESTPVYGIAVLEHSLLPEEASPVNVYRLTNEVLVKGLLNRGKPRNL